MMNILLLMSWCSGTTVQKEIMKMILILTRLLDPPNFSWLILNFGLRRNFEIYPLPSLASSAGELCWADFLQIWVVRPRDFLFFRKSRIRLYLHRDCRCAKIGFYLHRDCRCAKIGFYLYRDTSRGRKWIYRPRMIFRPRVMIYNKFFSALRADGKVVLTCICNANYIFMIHYMY